jgi:hypothetical protein
MFIYYTGRKLPIESINKRSTRELALDPAMNQAKSLPERFPASDGA